MSQVTRILSQIEQGDPRASEQLLPLIYEELRKLAASKLAQEKPGQTLQPTALVHEAYLRLIGPEPTLQWQNRGHFFAAAAEAMRRILINRARDKQRLKRSAPGGRLDLDQISVAVETPDEDLLALDEALAKLESHDAQMAELVKLRFYGGCTQQEAADLLGLPRRTADRHWAYARAWLVSEIQGDGERP